MIIKKIKITELISAFLLLLVSNCYALEFPLPAASDNMVGNPQTAIVENGEDFSDVALRYKIGYYEVFEANPGVNPDHPPEGTVLVIPTQYLLPPELKPNLILINLAEMRLYYLPQDKKTVYIFSVGIGKSDWNTPTGTMKVVKKIEHPAWTVPQTILKYRAAKGEILPKVVPPGPENPLGDYALRLSAGDYLIHGTNLPAGVGRRSSAGCIRLYNDDIKTLFAMVDVGTNVLITNEPYKAGWFNNKLYLEAHLPLLEQRLAAATGNMTAAIDVINKAEQQAPTKQLLKINWHHAFQVAKQHLSVPRIIGKSTTLSSN